MRVHGWLVWAAAVVLISPRLAAQTSEWAVVKQLAPDQKVQVQSTDGKSHAGRVTSVTDDGVRIGKKEWIQKQDVQRVLLWHPGHHGRNTLIGLGIGAGAGIGVGATCGGRDAFFSKGQCMALSVPMLGGIGAGIGAVIPSRGRWNEVYRSK